MANCSFSNSAKATDLTETRRTSLKPSKRSNIVVRSSSSTSRGMFCRKRVLFGRTYSSGTTAAPVFAARGFSAATAGLACAFASSSARLKSVECQYLYQVTVGGNSIPFCINRFRLCSSNMSVAFRLIVSSLCVFALFTFKTLPYSSKPFISSTASSADFSLSKTMNAWPLRFKLLFAMMSRIGP
jgi:hypothetical protein